MMIETRQVTVCLFNDPEAAREAIYELREAGFVGDDISLLAPDEAASGKDKGEKAREGAATGAVVGGLFGGLAGWLVGLGTLAIPGVGPFIAAGALAAALGGVVLGAGLGAIAGALVSMGIPENEAKYYEGEVRKGRSLVAVRGGRRNDDADRMMRKHGGYDAKRPAGAR
jgi:uncharacterized membrane protein